MDAHSCTHIIVNMTLFALPILILLMVSTIILLAFKRWKLASALVVVVLLLNWHWQVCPMHFFFGEESTDKTFRVVTYNIYPQVDSTQYDQWQRNMLEELKSHHPDILCLQEFKHTDMAWLEEELCKYFSYTEEMRTERKFIKWRLYSHYPMTNITRYKPTEELDTIDIASTFDKSIRTHTIRQPFYSADIHLPNGDSVTVFSCHLQSNGYSTIRRTMNENVSWFAGIGRYREAITSANKLRLWEAHNLRKVLDSIGNVHPIIVAGDINDFNQSESLTTIQGDNLHDAWWNGGKGLGLTYSGFGLRLRLDHILYNERLQLQQIQVGSSDLSDHRPLVADFLIK